MTRIDGPTTPVPLPVGDAPARPEAKAEGSGSPAVVHDDFEKSPQPSGNFFAELAGSGGPMVVAGPITTGGPAAGAPKEVTDFLSEVAAGDASLAPAFGEIRQAIDAGDYRKAAEALGKAERFEDLSALDDRKQALERQLDFLSKMQGAGIRPSYPPTEQQLVDYFKKLGGKPAEARAAFAEYTGAFHAHPGMGRDIAYSADPPTRGVPTATPDSWSELGGRPASGKANMAKQSNDCEGFGFMAEKLLGAAGFKVDRHLTVAPANGLDAHSMVVFTHPKEKGVTVTSNDGVFQGADAKAVARDGYAYATGRRYDSEGKMYEAGNATGKEPTFSGSSMRDAQANQVNGDQRFS